MRIPLHTLEGVEDFDVPSELVRQHLHFVLNTNQWKDAPELLTDRTLRFRRTAIETGKKVSAAKPARA